MASDRSDMASNDSGSTFSDSDDGRTSFRVVPGDSIGPFKILSVIGEGGFGVVFLAEQTEPIKRRVALKVIKVGMDTDRVVARFEAERQALAMMDHPGIAKVLEAGATDQGRPYFVMEYVKGVPLTEFCDAQQLDATERLELFAKVCDAVEHAHQKGIIHRDLKPRNILVKIDENDEPVPKVIDFGIAKATSQKLTEKTLFTHHGQMMGTPEYMSPEQAEVSIMDVDTRTDVYSLGVILYELLSGKLPFDPDELRSKGYAEIQRVIREDDPPKPSIKLSTTTRAESTQIAGARRTKLMELQSMLRRELEWIPLKALRKNRTDRYATVSAMGDDVRRYLHGEALEAGPERTSYRVKKMLRRNRGPVIAAALVAIALLAGLIGTTIFAVHASEQARVASEQSRLAAQQTAIAEEQMRLATESEQEANAQRVLAQEQAGRARASDVQSQRQRDEAIQQAYFGNIHAAKASYDADDIKEVHRRLDKAHALLGVEEEAMPFEWCYLKRKTDVSIATFDPDTWSGVRPVAFSADGRRLATTDDGGIRIRDVATGEILLSWEAHAGWANGLAFTRDGTRLVSVGHDKYIHVWDPATGECLVTMANHHNGLDDVAVSSDGTRLVASDHNSREIFVWDMTTGERIATIEGVINDGDCIAMTSDGSLVASPSMLKSATRNYSHQNNIQLWDAATGAHVAMLEGHSADVEALAFSPDGTVLVSGSSGVLDNIKVWDVATGECLAAWNGHGDAVRSIDFSPDGEWLASASNDGTVKLWDLASGVNFKTFYGHTSDVLSVAVSPDGMTLASGAQAEAKVWSVRDEENFDAEIPSRGRMYRSVTQPARESGSIHHVLFSPDGARVLTQGHSNHEDIGYIWDTATGEPLARLRGSGARRRLVFSPDGTMIAGGESLNIDVDDAIGMWDSVTGSTIAVLDGGENESDAHGTPLYGYWDWLEEDSEQPSRVRAVAFSPDGEWFVSSRDDGVITIRNVDALENPLTLDAHSGQVSSIVFSQDGRRFTSKGTDGAVKTWDVKTGAKLADVLLEGLPKGGVLSYGRDGIWLALGDGKDGIIKIWDCDSGQHVKTLNFSVIDNFYDRKRSTCDIAFHPGGTRMASAGSNGDIFIWDLATGEKVLSLQGHNAQVGALDFSTDGTRLVSVGDDYGVKIWSTDAPGQDAGNREAALAREKKFRPLAESWVQKADGDAQLVLALLERESRNRSSQEMTSISNLVMQAWMGHLYRLHGRQYLDRVTMGLEFQEVQFKDDAEKLHKMAEQCARVIPRSKEMGYPWSDPFVDIALRIAERSCSLTDYTNAPYLATLARVHFERGEVTDAVTWQVNAIEHLEEGADDAEYLAALERYRAAAADDGHMPLGAATAEP